MSKKYITLRNKSKDTCFIYPNIDPEHNIPDGSIPHRKLEGGGLKYLVVDELPTEDIDLNTIYLVPSGEEHPDYYDEYLYVNGEWEKIGNTRIDMSQYLKKVNTGGVVYSTDFQGNQNNWALRTNPDRYTIMFRGDGGICQVGTPVNDSDATTKKYVDDKFVEKVTSGNKIYGTENGVNVAFDWSYGVSPWSVIKRLGDGTVRVGTPVEDNDATTKAYVDGLLKHYVHNIKLKATNITVTLQIIDRSSTAYTLTTLMSYLSTKGFSEINSEYPASGVYGSSFRPVSGISGSGVSFLIYHSNTFNQETASNFTLTDIVVEV